MKRVTTVGEFIRSRRIKAGLTFRGLSKLSGLTPTTIFDIENGTRDPKLKQLELLAKAFGESPITLLRRYYSSQRR